MISDSSILWFITGNNGESWLSNYGEQWLKTVKNGEVSGEVWPRMVDQLVDNGYAHTWVVRR